MSATHSLTVRPLRSEDREAWLRLWEGYLDFYQASLDPEVTEVTWQRLVAEDDTVFGFGAFEGQSLVGIVHCVKHRATWTKGWYLYLEDLFTSPASRGKGAGEALIQAVYDKADALEASRVYWHTHHTNEVARRLYDRVGSNAGFIQYRRP
ncbi:MAG: GNAT family N-acetyltransferase [Pseudomonadota bacterium]